MTVCRSLSGEGKSERLLLRQRAELKEGRAAVIEESLCLEPIHDLHAQPGSTEEMQVVCRQSIYAGSIVLASTVRCYRFCDEADTAEPEPEPEPEPESVLGGGAVVAEAEASMEATLAAARARHGLAAGSDGAAAGPAS